MYLLAIKTSCKQRFQPLPRAVTIWQLKSSVRNLHDREPIQTLSATSLRESSLHGRLFFSKDDVFQVEDLGSIEKRRTAENCNSSSCRHVAHALSMITHTLAHSNSTMHLIDMHDTFKLLQTIFQRSSNRSSSKQPPTAATKVRCNHSIPRFARFEGPASAAPES